MKVAFFNLGPPTLHVELWVCRAGQKFPYSRRCRVTARDVLALVNGTRRCLVTERKIRVLGRAEN